MKNDPSSRAAAEQAIAALITLAAEDLPLKGRLLRAWLDHLSRINPDELSPEFHKKFLAMQMTMSRKGLAQDSVDALTSNEADALAQQMVYFALDLESLTVSQNL